MGDSCVTATHPALNSACCYTLGGKPPCQKKKSAPLLNPEGWLIDATGYAPGFPSPMRPISVLAQNLWGIPSVLIQVLFSLPICLLQGGVAKSYEGMKTPFCYVAKTLT